MIPAALARTSLLFAIGLITSSCALAIGQSISTTTTANSVDNTTIRNVVRITGPPDAKPGIKGNLTFNSNALVFSNSAINSPIALNRIIAVSAGYEKTEKGGTAGRVGRNIIPFGGGELLGVVSQRTVDLLTVEYRDEHGGYHGAVFVLPVKQAGDMKQKITPQVTSARTTEPQSCSKDTVDPKTIRLESVDSNGIDIPAEYKVLVYERLMAELHDALPSDTIYRAGDLPAGSGCTALTIHLTATAFKKGSRVARASTGPVGLFVGTTRIAFQVKIDDPSGKSIFDGVIKANNRHDTDSLNVTNNIAKTITKKVGRLMDKSAQPQQTATSSLL